MHPSTTPEIITALVGALPAQLQQPWVLAVAAVLVVLALAKAARPGGRRIVDPTRMFSAAQRAEGFARAGGRCELETVPFIRCRRKAQHGDHYFPHSKGGSTSMGNFVAACQRHNTSKGAKVMTFWYTQRLEARRRRYFGSGLNVHAGERYAQR